MRASFWFTDATLMLCAHMAKKEKSLSYKTIVTSDEGPTLKTSSKFDYLLQIISPEIVTLGIKASACRLRRGHNSTHSSISQQKSHMMYQCALVAQAWPTAIQQVPRGLVGNKHGNVILR